MSTQRDRFNHDAFESSEAPLSALWGQVPIRETVSAAAYRVLREAILQGRIPMGARVNELELANAWRVSRTPIRDALRRLEAEGLAQSVPGRGVIVPVLSLADVDELYELREVLEARAARRAAERAGPDFHARLNELIRAFGSSLKQGDLEPIITIDGDLHSAVASGSGSARLERAIDTVRGQVHQIRLRSFRAKGRAARSFREMAKLVAAIRSRDAARAEVAMREHIASVRADLPTLFESPD
jgi:DNA-binding GntR family transcriptional regulator